MEWEEKLGKLFRIVMVAIALNLLAIKIKVTFHIKISWLATLQFKESRKKTRENIYVAVGK